MAAAEGLARLILDGDDRETLTSVRTMDARSAVVRGLKQYLESLSFTGSGKTFKFQRVIEDWADPEQLGKLPGAVVSILDPADYDASGFTPRSLGRVEPGVTLFSGAEYKATVVVDVWATDREERRVLGMGMEDGLIPLDWMYGFYLELPYYFGRRVSYSLMSGVYMDNEGDAQIKQRRIAYTLQAELAQSRVRRLPTLQPRVSVEVGYDPTLSGD